jgi:hypothetical protein
MFATRVVVPAEPGRMPEGRRLNVEHAVHHVYGTL